MPAKKMFKKKTKKAIKKYTISRQLNRQSYNVVLKSTDGWNQANTMITDAVNVNKIFVDFRIADLINYKDYLLLWEFVKVKRITVEWKAKGITMQTSYPGAQAVVASNDTPYCYYYLNRNDNLVIPDRDTMTEHGNTVKKLATKDHKISFKPSYLVKYLSYTSITGDVNATYCDKKSRWLLCNDTLTPLTQHYGVNVLLENCSQQNYILQPKFSMDLEFMGKRQ